MYFLRIKALHLNGSIGNNVLRKIQVSEILRNNVEDMIIYGVWGPFLRIWELERP